MGPINVVEYESSEFYSVGTVPPLQGNLRSVPTRSDRVSGPVSGRDGYPSVGPIKTQPHGSVLSGRFWVWRSPLTTTKIGKTPDPRRMGTSFVELFVESSLCGNYHFPATVFSPVESRCLLRFSCTHIKTLSLYDLRPKSSR